MKNNYFDKYFTRHHLLLKIRQTIVMLFSWVILLVPIFITTSTYIAYRTNGKMGHFFWHYREGFQELNFLMAFLLFAVGMVCVFCLTMGYIQKQRIQGLTSKWPMFNVGESSLKQRRAEQFMTNRFGDAKVRTGVKYTTIAPEQNLTKNQLKEVIENRTGYQHYGF